MRTKAALVSARSGKFEISEVDLAELRANFIPFTAQTRMSGVEVGAGNPQWLALHETLDGQAVLGLVGLAPDLPVDYLQGLREMISVDLT